MYLFVQFRLIITQTAILVLEVEKRVLISIMGKLSYNCCCYIPGNFFPTACSHWLLRGHMTSNSETVSRQNLQAGNIAKSITSEGNSALLPANVDRRPLSHRGVMNFRLSDKSLKDWSLGKQLILFPSSFMVPKILEK